MEIVNCGDMALSLISLNHDSMLTATVPVEYLALLSLCLEKSDYEDKVFACQEILTSDSYSPSAH